MLLQLQLKRAVLLLLLLFPSKTDGNLGLWAFNTKTKANRDLLENGKQATIDNFNNDFDSMEEVAKRFNEFAFMPADGENSTNEVKNIGSFDVSTDEPVEVNNNTNTDNEETEMKNFEPINEEDELKDTKWVEIPNTNAHGVTVTEDGEENADPFADAGADVPADTAAP